MFPRSVRRSFLRLALLAAAICLGFPVDAIEVEVPDAKLEELIRAQLIVYGDPLTDADLAELEELSDAMYGEIAAEDQVKSLEGLQHAVNLRTLSLVGHDVADLSPISNLEYLERLDLSDNRKLSTAGLVELESLASLNLFSTNIDSASFLPSLVNLEYLVLWGNRIAAIPNIAHLSKLATLNVGNNQISDISSIHDLPELEELDIGSNNISSIDSLAGFPKLQRLYISENPITDASAVAEFTTLRRLEANFIADPELAHHLAGLTELTYLSLYRCDIADLTSFTALAKLEVLKLDSNRVLDLSPLVNLTALRKLNMPSNQVRDLSPLVDLALLEEVNLWGNYIDFSEGTPSQIAYDYLSDQGLQIDVGGQKEIVVTASLPKSTYARTGAAGTIVIESETYWTVDSDADWIELESDSGFADSQLAFKVAANPTGTSRSATLNVSGIELNLSQEYDVAYFAYLALKGADVEDPVYWTTADADGDGDSNYLEYLADLDPTDPEARFVFKIERAPSPGASAILTLSKPLAGDPYLVEASADLSSWSPFEPSADTSDEFFRHLAIEPLSVPSRFFRITLSDRK